MHSLYWFLIEILRKHQKKVEYSKSKHRKKQNTEHTASDNNKTKFITNIYLFSLIDEIIRYRYVKNVFSKAHHWPRTRMRLLSARDCPASALVRDALTTRPKQKYLILSKTWRALNPHDIRFNMKYQFSWPTVSVSNLYYQTSYVDRRPVD